MRTGLPKAYEHLQQAGGGLTDGQLLARFVAARDEASFAALLRRHGPMVLGVCRRVLRDAHDAEDAFQATFLVLARKAASVVKRESVGCFLYSVAFHTAQEAGRVRARRRVREKQVKDMPDPEAAPAEVSDWLPLLDRELNRLSEKYRAAVVLCDLEGRPRREAARLLGVPEGTVSSRLSKARKLLAKRLAGRGLLSVTALAAAVGVGTASAQVPAALASSTTTAAALVAAGQLAAVATPAVTLMKGVMKVMLLKKLRLVVGVVMVGAALGAVGFVCRPGDEARAQQFAPPGSGPMKSDGKPSSELEALRKENELLKFNLRIVLEKSAAQEKELEGLRGRPSGLSGTMSAPRLGTAGYGGGIIGGGIGGFGGSIPASGSIPANNGQPGGGSGAFAGGGFAGGTNSIPATNVIGNGTGGKAAQRGTTASAAQEVEAAALKALHSAHDKDEQRAALDALEKAVKNLRKQLDHDD